MSDAAQSPISSGNKIAELAHLLESIIQKMELGETIDLEHEIAQAPEHETQLRRFWPSLQVLVSLGQSQDSDRGAHATARDPLTLQAEAPGQLGEFHIVRELGRGGMGVVYEAVQAPLGRHVALKVLPFAAMLDQRQLTRFQNEARAAASLHHTNIVPVFSVGCDHDRYYYAMQLIRGHSLAELLQERRDRTSQPDQPGERAPQAQIETANAHFDDTLRPQELFTRIARLGIQAAEALHCAHENGVVHRDVKPSNLLIDTSGKLWVADFGLARLGGDVGVTLTGDMLGTLRYMSPEQAAGMPAVVDHRTDIYSLGATLYELATDRPVVQARERAAMLREIAEMEPAHPRTFTQAMPVDLETILLKCLAKEPAARYDSAQALADDLRRFLEHKPVAAKRPTPVMRARKFLQRNAALVTSTLAAIVITGFVAGLLLLNSYRAERAERDRALSNLHHTHAILDRLFEGLKDEPLLLTAPKTGPLRDLFIEQS